MVSISESSNDSSSLHVASPGASLSREGSLTSDDALLESSVESSDDSSRSEGSDTLVECASGESTVSSLFGNAGLVSSSEPLDDSGVLRDLN